MTAIRAGHPGPVPAGRRRLLAEIGRRSTNQALHRADVDRRHPVLLATLAETYVEVLNELVQLLDQALAGAESRARHELSQRMVDRAKAEADRARLLDEILDVLWPIRESPTPTPAAWCANGSVCRVWSLRGGPPGNASSATTATSICSRPVTSACAPSPQP